MGKAAAPPDEFTAAMQQLSAEASKSLTPALSKQNTGPQAGDIRQLESDVKTLGERLESWQISLEQRLDTIARATAARTAVDTSEQFKKIEEQLTAIRSTESVNQRLFDSLHDELLKYRDNFLHESLQKPFIHDLVMLFDDLTSLSEQFRSAAHANERGHLVQWRDNLENAIHSLVEILHRFEVKEIEPKEHIDRALHKVVSFEPADFPEEDGRIVMRVRRGFFWRGKLIRPEEVIAKRFG